MQKLNRGNLDKELFVAEYCFAQGHFHHSYLKNSMETNKESIERILKIKNPEERAEMVYQLSWIPFSIGTYDETADDIDEMRKIMKIL